MKYYKIVENNIIVSVGEINAKESFDGEITEEEYNSILSVIQNKPEDTDTIIYKLHADTLEYVAYDRPEEPTPTDPTIDSIIEEVASNGY